MICDLLSNIRLWSPYILTDCIMLIVGKLSCSHQLRVNSAGDLPHAKVVSLRIINSFKISSFEFLEKLSIF